MAEDKKEKDSEASEAKAEAAPSKKKKGKLLFIVLGVVVLLTAIAVPTAIFMTKAKSDPVAELGADAAHAHPGETAAITGPGEDELGEDEEPLGAIYPLETFVVNLSGGQYLRAQIQIEFNGRDVPPRFYTRLVQIRDGMIGLLTKKTATDLQSAKGKEILKSDIKDVVNETLRQEEVKSVYFTQFVIQ